MTRKQVDKKKKTILEKGEEVEENDKVEEGGEDDDDGEITKKTKQTNSSKVDNAIHLQNHPNLIQTIHVVNKPKPTEFSGGFLISCIVALLAVAAIMYFPSSNSVLLLNNRINRKYLNYETAWDAFKKNAKASLERFHGDLLYDNRLGEIRHAKVLQLECTNENLPRLEKVISDFFPSSSFDVLTLDGSNEEKLHPDFFVAFKTNNRPLLVMLKNAHQASWSVLKSFSHSMSSPVLVAEDGTRRSPHNVGFLFIGASLPSGPQCDKVDLLQHDMEVLGWVQTFVTRLTDFATIC